MYAGHLSKEGKEKKDSVLLWEPSQRRKLQQHKKITQEIQRFPSYPYRNGNRAFGRGLKESTYLRVAGKGREGWEGRGEERKEAVKGEERETQARMFYYDP